MVALGATLYRMMVMSFRDPPLALILTWSDAVLYTIPGNGATT